MSIIQQPTLFDIDFLAQLDCHERHAEIFSPIDFTPFLRLFDKQTLVGPPVKVNYEAAIRALITRFLEKIPTIKALVTRLKEDVRFKLSLGFLYSDTVPSESTFCRIVQTLTEHKYLLEAVNLDILFQADQAFDIFNEVVAVDATAIDAHTKPVKTENPTCFSTEQQRSLPTQEILDDLTRYPSWGKKKNSQGKNTVWFGFKSHFAVSSQSEFLLANLFTSAYISDMTVAIPLLRKLSDMGLAGNRVIFDKGYDAKAIYNEAHSLGFEPFIPLKRSAQNDGEVDNYYRPTCFLEHSYHFDSMDKRYGALKYIRPEVHCRDCPLKNEGLCQKVIKVKQQTDFRKYNNPARGTAAWERQYKQRSSVERVNAYLKEGYQLNDTDYYRPEQVEIEQLLIQLAYNAKKLANLRIGKRNVQKKLVV